MQGHVIGWIIVIDNHQLQYDVIMIVTNVSECLILYQQQIPVWQIIIFWYDDNLTFGSKKLPLMANDNKFDVYRHVFLFAGVYSMLCWILMQSFYNWFTVAPLYPEVDVAVEMARRSKRK